MLTGVFVKVPLTCAVDRSLTLFRELLRYAELFVLEEGWMSDGFDVVDLGIPAACTQLGEDPAKERQ